MNVWDSLVIQEHCIIVLSVMRPIDTNKCLPVVLLAYAKLCVLLVMSQGEIYILFNTPITCGLSEVWSGDTSSCLPQNQQSFFNIHVEKATMQ